jgi:hypothetical protein
MKLIKRREIVQKEYIHLKEEKSKSKSQYSDESRVMKFVIVLVALLPSIFACSFDITNLHIPEPLFLNFDQTAQQKYSFRIPKDGKIEFSTADHLRVVCNARKFNSNEVKNKS